MSDISKCLGTGCNRKESCYRYTAPEGWWQSYMLRIPVDVETQECEHYWDNKGCDDGSETWK